MSADNYKLIRKARGGYVVSDESASSDDVSPVSRGVWWATLKEAYAFAEEDYAEYGIHLSPEVQEDLPS